MPKRKDENEPGELLTLSELAAYLKIAERTAYGWVADGKLPGFKIGAAWRFDKADIQKWVEKQKAKGQG
ncbi:MAG: helix-turn-helix domain-containing protein [Kiritimatiellia bacterium]